MPYRAPSYTHAIPGDHNMLCDRCGAKAKRSELVYDAYYGLWVHPHEYDGQHPLDREPAKVTDEQSVPYSHAEPPDRFDDVDVDGGDVGIPDATYDAARPAGSVATGTFVNQVGTGTVTKHVP